MDLEPNEIKAIITRMKRANGHLASVIRMMEDGWVTPEPIITRRYRLDEIDDALHASAEKRDLSGVIVPSL